MNKSLSWFLYVLFGAAFMIIFGGIAYSINTGLVEENDSKDFNTYTPEQIQFLINSPQDNRGYESIPTTPTFAISKMVEATSYELELLNNLNPEAKNFFLRSLEIRSSYPPNADYKHFIGGYYSDGSRFEMTPDGYWILHPGLYPNINPGKFNPEDNRDGEQKYYYRYIKDCNTRETIERQVIYKEGYGGPYLGDQYQAQCIGDRSFDTYYFESNTKLE
jgi:hypothetical protein